MSGHSSDARELVSDPRLLETVLQVRDIEPLVCERKRSRYHDQITGIVVKIGKSVDLDTKTELRKIVETNATAAISSRFKSFKEFDLEDVVNEIRWDLLCIAYSLESAVDHPFISAVALSYRAGRLPTLPLEIELPLQRALATSKNEATKLLDIAAKKYLAKKILAENEAELFDEKLSQASKGMPTGELLLEVLRKDRHGVDLLQDAKTAIVTAIQDLPKGVRLPKKWKQLLKGQQTGEIDWNILWKSVSDQMPAVLGFLSKHCLGIAILLRAERDPALLYVYRYKAGHTKAGFSFGAFLGGIPLGPKPPKAGKVAFDLLPDVLQDFYSNIHNGWCSTRTCPHRVA